MAVQLLETKAVKDLLNNSYFVPAYQRGYRWKQTQIEDLLDDLHAFMESEKKPGEWYSLQPVVVKPHKKTENEIEYELLDGQQRLTTLTLIIHYINEMFRGKQKISEPNLLYETRKDSTGFIQGLSIDNPAGSEQSRSNIDFHFIVRAYSVIHQWFIDNERNLRTEKFIDTILNDAKVIWYEVDEEDSIAIFTRLNSGKIPLTNAELIKALFLRRSNYSAEERLGKPWQLRIASEWDAMETKLQHPGFWQFICPVGYATETHIDLVFKLLVGTEETGDHGLFRSYQKSSPIHDLGTVEEHWQKVRDCFTTLEEWFGHFELYHLVGFLVASESISFKGIKDLYCKSQSAGKAEFLKELKQQVLKTLPEALKEVEYGKSDIKVIRKVLLLHNIVSILNSGQEHLRYPFNLHKTEKWDVEHVHSVSDKLPTTDKDRKEWLKASLAYIPNEQEAGMKLRAEIDQMVNNIDKLGDTEFASLAGRVIDIFNDQGMESEKNGLQNLVLLDAETNRGYKNALFPHKRKKIIERETAGQFVPLCTKNVFLKLFSPNQTDLTIWHTSDQEAYFNDIGKQFDHLFHGKGADHA